MDVVVTGIGCLTSTGIGKENVRTAFFSGDDGVGRVQRFDTSKLRTKNGYEIKETLPLIEKNATRLVTLGYFAANEAVVDSRLNMSSDLCLLVGSGLGDEEYILEMDGPKEYSCTSSSHHRLGPQLSSLLGIRGGVIGNGTACAAALSSIVYGYDLIKNGEYEAVIAGGAETFSINSMAYFDRVTVGPPPDKVQPFDRNRRGMLLGEGAGFVVLESEKSALRRGKDIYGKILGYGMSSDAFHISNMDENSIARTISMALEDANIEPASIGYIAAHGTGTPINDIAETRALKSIYKKHAYSVPISSVKSMIGHTGGASGALGLIGGLFVLQRQCIIPTINHVTPDPECDLDYVPNIPRNCRVNKIQVNSFGFGGANCSVIVER